MSAQKYGRFYQEKCGNSVPALPVAITKMMPSADFVGAPVTPFAGSGKMLIVMQFYSDDKPLAMALCRLLADVEKEKCKWADFAFLPRFDCTVDNDIVAVMEGKFDHVYVLQSTRRQTGWPAGPNAMAMDLFRIVHDKTESKEWHYDAVLMAEADCLPLRTTWIKELMDEWHNGRQMVLGAWFGSARDVSRAHINGNLMFSPSLTARLPGIWNSSFVPHAGWDSYWFPDWVRWSRASRLIFSDYRLGTARRPWPGCEYLWQPKFQRGEGNPLQNVPLMPCWLHGVKTAAGLICVRNKLCL